MQIRIKKNQQNLQKDKTIIIICNKGNITIYFTYQWQ